MIRLVTIDRTFRWTLAATVATAVGLVALAGSGYKVTQIRNSMIATPGSPGDFDWTPDSWPDDFLRQEGDPPVEFREAVEAVLADEDRDAGELERALATARHLGSGPGPGGGGIKSSTLDAYRVILSEPRGYCADYTQVMNGLAYAEGVAVREWGMSFDDYSGDGHAFNEIYDSDLSKWILVDSFYSLYFTDRRTGTPLSALELRSRLAAGEGVDELEVVPIRKDRFGFRNEEAALEYYRRGVDGFYLYFGNNVFSYDANPVIERMGFSRALEETAGILLGLRPEIRLVATGTNASSMQTLFLRRNLFFALAASFAILLLLVMVQLWASIRRAAG